MTTPLIIVSILIVPTLAAILLGLMLGRPGLHLIGGRIALAIAFVFFSVGHFVMTEPMIAMLPEWVPGRRSIVLGTGVLEAALAVALLVPRWSRPAAIACIAVLMLFFPVNVYAAINAIGPGGHQWGPTYLLIRGPVQILLIVWTYWFILRPVEKGHEHAM
jgi:uncharacterized membrane protein